MKLTDIDTVKGSDEGAVIDLRHPATGEKLDMWIKVAGPDSKLAKRRQAEIRRKMRGQKAGKIDLDMWEAEALETRVAVTLDWGGIEFDKPLECTPENVRMVYSDFPWVADQVDEFQADRGNFIAKATTAP